MEPQILPSDFNPEPFLKIESHLQSLSQEPSVELRPAVALELVTYSHADLCPFWINIAEEKKSQDALTPHDISSITTMQECFKQISHRGVNFEPPLMISNTMGLSPRFVYVLQPPPINISDSESWVQNIVQVVNAWKQPLCGLHFQPSFLSSKTLSSVLTDVLRQLVLNTTTKRYQLLLDDQDYNCLIQLAVRLKKDLDQKGIDLYIFH